MKNIVIILLLVNVSVFAQQDAQYTNHMYNTININPAYAGSRGVVSIFGLYRSQWVGLDGAPVTSTASINTPIENTNLGVGLSFVNDKIGVSDESAISVDLSYAIQVSNNYKVAFGVKGTANLFNVDYTKLNRYDLNDPKFQNNVENEFSPGVGAGIYFYSDKLYLGLSVPDFLESRVFNDNLSITVLKNMHYYLIGGYVFDINPSLQFKPAFISKIVEGAPLQVDLSVNFLFNEKFVLGAAWRWDAAMSFMAGFQVSNGMYIGYGYDLETTKLSNYNSGSHEIFLRFELSKNRERMETPRFF
ncbi:type IX secretion system membrane protein PorP/SprF [Flavobacterium sp. RSP29]|uniref:PorP/SprF family type IX secretion system membrane protein n=1 Tax=Flavobacterium sp. RSP29 TaxID=3401731 RepID=UPI003AAEB486